MKILEVALRMIVELRVPEEVWPRRTEWYGRVVSINKKIGDTVTKGEIIAEIEIEKVVLGIESPYNGRVVDIKATEGEQVKPGSLLALIEE